MDLIVCSVAISMAIYFGLHEIADAIRYKKTSVTFTDPINIDINNPVKPTQPERRGA